MNSNATKPISSPSSNNGRPHSTLPPNRCASPATPGGPLTPNRSNANPSSDISDRNNNATPPNSTRGLPPPPPVGARRPSQPRSPLPVGARPKDLPPGAAPLGSIPRPYPPSTNSSSVPLLASQLGRPVNLGDRGGPGGPSVSGPPNAGVLGASGLPHFTQHHLNLISHTLSPFAAIPTGNGRIMARNINGTCKILL